MRKIKVDSYFTTDKNSRNELDDMGKVKDLIFRIGIYDHMENRRKFTFTTGLNDSSQISRGLTWLTVVSFFFKRYVHS